MAFAKYKYIPGASHKDIFTDIKGLLTGTITTIGGVTAACDQPNSYMVATTAPGWEALTHNYYDQYMIATPNVSFAGMIDMIWVGGSINRYYAIGSFGVMSSVDRVYWVNHTLPTQGVCTAIAFNGTTIVVISAGAAKSYLFTSTDGNSFTMRDVNLRTNTNKQMITVLGTTFIVATNYPSAYMSSADGITWSASSLAALPGAVNAIASTYPYVTTVVYYATTNGVYSITNAQVVAAVFANSILITNADILANTTALVVTQAPAIYFKTPTGFYHLSNAGVLTTITLPGGISSYLDMVVHSSASVASDRVYVATTSGLLSYNAGALINTNSNGLATTSATKALKIYSSGASSFTGVGTNIAWTLAYSIYNTGTPTIVSIPAGNWVNVGTSGGSSTAMAVGTDIAAYSASVGGVYASKTIPTGTWVAVASSITTANEWMVVSSTGAVVTTGDNGTTWTARTAIGEACDNIYHCAGTAGYYIHATGGNLYFTANASATPVLISLAAAQVRNVTPTEVRAASPYLILTYMQKTSVSSDSAATFNHTTNALYINNSQCAVSGTKVYGYSATNNKLNVSTDDGVTWVSRTTPFTGDIISLSVVGSDVVVVLTTNTYTTIDDGVTWSVKPNVLATATAASSDGTKLVVASTSNSCLSSKGATSGSFRAQNLDTLSYKYMQVNINANGGAILMQSCESITNGVMLNADAFSGSTLYCQNINANGGGVLYLGSSNRYAFMYGIQTGGVAGSATGNGATIIAEYARTDAWSTAANGYPTHAWTNTSVTTWYPPRVKFDVGVDSTTLAFAIAGGITNTKTATALDGSQAVVAPDIYLYNTTGTYLIEGGAVLGGIKSSTTSFGSTTDELNISSSTYVIFATGTTRHIVPKF